MKFIYQTLPLIVLLLLSWSLPSYATTSPVIVDMQEGYTYTLDGFEITVDHLDSPYSGTGSLYFAALDMDLDITFSGLMITDFGQQLSGEVITKRGERLADITSAMTTLQGISLPIRSKMFLSGFSKDVQRTAIDLDLDAGTIVDKEYLSFRGLDVKVEADDICLEDVEMAMMGDGNINDFQFPIRIMAGDPDDEKLGSYVTFTCKGFKSFALTAEYDFPQKQLKINGDLAVAQAGSDSRKDSLVTAYFQIRSAKLGEFIATGKMDPFKIPGAEDLSFTVDSIVIDYSDVQNVDGFSYIDKKTKVAVDTKWKGIYIKELKLTLPKPISACNADKPMEIAVQKIVYDRADGMSLTVAVNNLLSLQKGNINGWGISIDTMQLSVEYNSIGKFNMVGEVFVPITAKDENIKYAATFGKDSLKNTQANFVLKLGSTYTVPFLNNAKLKLEKASVVGVRYENKKYAPFANFSGEFDIKIGGQGSKLPEINFPSLGFQDLKLNDIKAGIKKGAEIGKAKAKEGLAVAKQEVTAGLDKMTVSAFTLGGKAFKVDNGDEEDKEDVKKDDKTDEKEDEAKDEESKGNQKVGGFPINVKKWKFQSVTDSTTKESLKLLGADFGINFTSKSGGGLTGEGNIGIKAKIDYAKLLGAERWQAIQYKGTDIGKIAIKGQMGNTSFEGLLAFISGDVVYGTGLKGGFKLNFGGKASLDALGQFGKVNEMRYFFIDVMAVSSKVLIPLGSVDIHGIGGGLYYNMEQTPAPPQKDITKKTPFTINPEPGISLSGTKYIPKKDLIGFNAAVVIALPQKPDVFSADVALSIEINRKTLGVERLGLRGGAYFMAEDLLKREEAPMIAKVDMIADFKRGAFTGSLSYKLNYPKKDPILVGSGQGSFQMDMDKEDGKDLKQYFVFGTPTKRFSIESHVPKLGKVGEMTGYVMIGDSLALPGPLTGMFAKYNSDPDYKKGIELLKDKISNGGGVSLGVDVKLGKKVVAGPVYMGLEFQMGFDLLMLKTTLRCKGQSGLAGFNGWYGNGKAYTGLKGEAGMTMDSWFYKGDIKLLDIETTALLQAQFPNPVYMKGNLDIEASVLAGRVKVNKNLKFTLGEACEEEKVVDPAALIADIEAIGDMQPVDGNKEAQIYHNPRVAFNFAASNSINDKPKSDDILKLKPTSFQLFELYPYIAETAFVEKVSGAKVEFEPQWDAKQKIFTFKNRAFLKPNTEYKVDIKVQWARSENGGQSKPINIEGKTDIKVESKSITFKTTGQPDKIVAGMIDAKRHMPGKNQRNWHKGFSVPELQFSSTGAESYFAKTKKKTIGGKSMDINYTYEVWLTDQKTKEVNKLPLSATPGDKLYSYLVEKTISSSAGSIKVFENKVEPSKSIEFRELDKSGVLKPSTVYKLQIVGVPQIDDSAQKSNDNLTAKIEDLSNSVGVKVVSVKNKLADQAIDNSMAVTEDVLYEYTFSTSKYNSLKDKLEASTINGPFEGNQVSTNPFPYQGGMKNILVNGSSGKKVGNDYYFVKNDEGFDQWDMRRLELNVELDEFSHKHPMTDWLYIDKPGKVDGFSKPTLSRLAYVRKAYADSGLGLYKVYGSDASGAAELKFKSMIDNILSVAWEVPGYWHNVSHAKNANLTLTENEINSGIINHKRGTGPIDLLNGDSQVSSDAEYDAVFSIKRKRTLQKQLETLDLLYSLVLDKIKSAKIVPELKVTFHWFFGPKVSEEYRTPKESEVLKYARKEMEKRGTTHAYFFKVLEEAHDYVKNQSSISSTNKKLAITYKFPEEWKSAEDRYASYKDKFPDGTNPVKSDDLELVGFDSSVDVKKEGKYYQVNGDFYIVKRERNSNEPSKYVIKTSGQASNPSEDGRYQNSPLITWTKSNAVEEIWRFEHIGGGVHYITNKLSGRRMDLYSGSTANKNRIYQWDKNGNEKHQKWKIYDSGSNNMALEYIGNSSKVIDLQNAMKNGTNVQIYDWSRSDPAQKIRLVTSGLNRVVPSENVCYVFESESQPNHYIIYDSSNASDASLQHKASDKVNFENSRWHFTKSQEDKFKVSIYGYDNRKLGSNLRLEQDAAKPDVYYIRYGRFYWTHQGNGNRMVIAPKGNDQGFRQKVVDCNAKELKEMKIVNQNSSSNNSVRGYNITLKN